MKSASGRVSPPADLCTAPAEPRRPFGMRVYVGGFLYLEGLVMLLLGLVLLLAYWPPTDGPGGLGSPISKVGMWICIGSVIYMLAAGLGMFVYGMLFPPREMAETALARRTRRYAAMRYRTPYVFDETVGCEADAEEAYLARKMV